MRKCDFLAKVRGWKLGPGVKLFVVTAHEWSGAKTPSFPNLTRRGGVCYLEGARSKASAHRKAERFVYWLQEVNDGD